MPTEAAVTAIICMQPYVQDSREYALNRMTGTLIGAGWGLLLLLVLLIFPALGNNLYILYAVMGAGVLVSLYTSVVLHKPDSSSLAAIVFICIVANFPEIEDPLGDTMERIFGVMLGTAAAVGVNVAHLPRRKKPDRVFFIRSADLIPDRFAQISPSILFRLNSLLRDGAKICLISRHAPAFFTAQLHTVTMTVPMIVMDGAALYDANENRYLYTEKLRQPDAVRLMERLDYLGRSYFIYTVHRKKTCIFHCGAYRDEEREVLSRLQRTPYRTYLDEEIYTPDEIVYIKLIDRTEETERLQKQLYTFIHGRRLRSSIQPQTGVSGVSGLYIYSGRASVHTMENRLIRLLRLENPSVQAEEVFLPSGYRSEHDAMHLLSRLYNLYEPVYFPPERWKKSAGNPSGTHQ